MSNIANNLKYLRKKKGLTQQQFADAMSIKRSLIGAYEEERAEPKYELLKSIAEFFELSIDEFINEQINEKWKPTPISVGSNLRILSITVDKDDKENIELVPVKASAGYLNGFADPQYIQDLPKFNIPIPSLSQGTYRAFEIKGDSMLPIESGSIIVGQYVDNWNDIKQGETYVVVSKQDGVVYKRIGSKYKEDKELKLVSDNKVYEPYSIPGDEILEIWQAKAYFTTSLPSPSAEPSIENLSQMMAQMQKTIAQMGKN
jgi:transcriptional regulator with XRE-family HTH domain